MNQNILDMRTYLLLLVLLTTFFVQAQKSKNTDAAAEENKSKIPATHAVYSMADYSLSEADSFYHNGITKEDNAVYSTDVKNTAFSILMDKGLADKGTEEQKKYYVSEQLKLDNNSTTYKQFYTLLLSCRSFMPKDELTKNAAAFYDKNKAAINKMKWAEPAQKNEKITELMKEHKVFNRYIAVAMKD